MIELRTLGTCQIVVGEERLGPQSPYAFALALYLSIERGRRHSRDELLPVFFPGVPEGNAAHSLRQNLYKLRQLGVPAETTAAGTIIAAADVRDDYSALLATSELPDPQAERLPGEFLPGYWPRISEEYTRWLDVQRDAINSALRRAYVSRILDRRAVARWDEVERFARACLAIDPLNEEATLALAEALALSGSKAAGVKVLDRYLEELGAEAGALTLPASVLRRRISERYRPTRVVGELPLIGREEEIRILHDSLTEALAGSGSSIWLAGEPGIGKTRLVREFTSVAALSGARVVKAECQPQDVHHPLRIFYDVVPELLAMPGAIGVAAETLDLLRSLDASTAQHPHIADIRRGRSAGHTDPVRIIADAIGDLLGAVSDETPLVLAFDDTHWADPISKKIIRSLWDTHDASRLVLVVSSREPVDTHLRLDRQKRQIRLGGIGAQPSVRFLREASSRLGHTISNEIVERSLGLGAGNPFFLRLLAEHFSVHPDSTGTPPRLRELIEQRVSAVSHSARSILLTCAILSRHSTIQRLEAVLEMPRYQLATGIGELETRNLITADGNSISSAHPLIADCVLSNGGSAQLSVIRHACAELLESAARTTGHLSLYWDAHDLWSAHGDVMAAARCAADAAQLDALSALVQTIDTGPSSPRPSGGRDITSRRDKDVAATQSLRSSGRRTGGHSDHIVASSAENADLSSPDGRSLLRLAQDKRNVAATRLRAAVAALSIAEYSADTALATEAYTAAIEAGMRAEGNAHADMQRAVMAYHSVFGRREEALLCAEAIDRLAANAENADSILRAQLNAAEAFSRCGHIARSLHLLDRVYRSASTYLATDKANNAAVSAFWHARQSSDKELQTLWMERSHPLENDTKSPSHLTYIYNQGLCAADNEDWDTLAPLSATLEQGLPAGRSRHHAALVDALRVRLTAETAPSQVDHTAVLSLTEWCLLTGRTSPQDDVALSVTVALRTRAPGTERDFLRRYLACRRQDTFPILRALSEIATAAG